MQTKASVQSKAASSRHKPARRPAGFPLLVCSIYKSSRLLSTLRTYISIGSLQKWAIGLFYSELGPSFLVGSCRSIHILGWVTQLTTSFLLNIFFLNFFFLLLCFFLWRTLQGGPFFFFFFFFLFLTTFSSSLPLPWF